ncbi:Isoleucine-tRNA ligase [Rhizoctonia solani]|uniref:Isoleucine-tRNA ligase n=1 Tax=Rhizoctonia solani TaxID=456999 RepID=A0A8H8NYA6_9AGAM|nr:Isoleucine-tRNA ligase [Rhizoctonia solani]QRW21123.1 Isoleucine-tRNA ligase [Rhizoctonia solani]
MSIATFVYQCLSYPQRRKTIQNALRNALNTQARLSYRLPEGPEFQPFTLEFHRDWWHEGCEVKEWYNSLLQAGISTTFRCIRHWKKVDPPFNHEFLEIELEDNRSCILERMGNGFDFDALRWTGCSSCDIIQCFPSTQEATRFINRRNCRLLIQVIFPRSFDLTDVLKICYTMKQHPNAKQYTLQHFNCYFLCCTILSILVRHVASWQDRIAPSTWESIVAETLFDLSQSSPQMLLDAPVKPTPDPSAIYFKRTWRNHLPLCLHNPKKDMIPLKLVNQTFEASDYSHSINKYVAVGIYALLDEHTQRRGSKEFLLRLLRSRLSDIVYESLREEVSNCLWQDRLKPSVLNAIRPYVAGLITFIRNDVNNTADSIKMGDLIGGINSMKFPRDDLNFSSIQKEVQRGFFRAFIRICYHHINITRADYEMETFEGRHPRWKRIVAFILALFVALLTYPAVVLFPHYILKIFGTLRQDLVILEMCSSFEGAEYFEPNPCHNTDNQRPVNCVYSESKADGSRFPSGNFGTTISIFWAWNVQ